MSKSLFLNPAACVARGIENAILKGQNSKYLGVTIGCGLIAHTLAAVVFPVSLLAETLFKRIPKCLFAVPFSKDIKKTIKFTNRLKKIEKFVLGFLFTLLSFRSPDVVSGLFLKKLGNETAVRPFGVEKIYGKIVEKIEYPETAKEVQTLVLKAKKEGRQISIIGAGMSQGTQTVPEDEKNCVIHTKKLNEIKFSSDHKTVKVGAGATWEEVQIAANQRGKSVIVKQASDVFSIGGSIGINCHGWAHEYGAISSTVLSIDIIDAEGNLKTLTKDDEMFGCFFGTLGYFGIIVSATFQLTDNVPLVESTEEVQLDDFIENYETKIKDQNIPLFGGRLCLDDLEGNPLRKVCMVKYNQDPHSKPQVTEPFLSEPKYGKRMERISLKALGHLSHFSARRAISSFWKSERSAMLKGRSITRNEALHPPIKSFMMLHHSNLHSQWLQEYFIKKENLPNFLRYLGAQLKANQVRLLNATIRPTPKDTISILPYAEQDRYAVVICFDQYKTNKWLNRTKNWIEEVNNYLVANGDVYYQAYMPYATREQFEKCYGKERVERMRKLKKRYDPENRFGNAHTVKYFD